jgi:hypothetical protein
MPDPHSPDCPDAETPRRRYLAGVAATAAVAVAGCSDSGDDDAPESEPDYEDFSGEDLGNPAVRFYDTASGKLVTDAENHEGESHWHRQPIELPRDSTLSMRAEVLDTESRTVPVGPDGVVTLAVSIADGTPSDRLTVSVDGNEVTVIGNTTGEAEIVFDFVRTEDETVIWTSPPLLFDVV